MASTNWLLKKASRLNCEPTRSTQCKRPRILREAIPWSAARPTVSSPETGQFVTLVRIIRATAAVLVRARRPSVRGQAGNVHSERHRSLGEFGHFREHYGRFSSKIYLLSALRGNDPVEWLRRLSAGLLRRAIVSRVEQSSRLFIRTKV